jgi:hypothetical protein
LLTYFADSMRVFIPGLARTHTSSATLLKVYGTIDDKHVVDSRYRVDHDIGVNA